MPGRWPRLERRRVEITIAFHPLTPRQHFILSLIHLAFCCAGGIALVLFSLLLRHSPLLAALGLCLMASYAYAYILAPARHHWGESEARYNWRVARARLLFALGLAAFGGYESIFLDQAYLASARACLVDLMSFLWAIGWLFGPRVLQSFSRYRQERRAERQPGTVSEEREEAIDHRDESEGGESEARYNWRATGGCLLCALGLGAGCVYVSMFLEQDHPSSVGGWLVGLVAYLSLIGPGVLESFSRYRQERRAERQPGTVSEEGEAAADPGDNPAP